MINDVKSFHYFDKKTNFDNNTANYLYAVGYSEIYPICVDATLAKRNYH